MSRGTRSFTGANEKALTGFKHYYIWLVLVAGAMLCQLLLAACGDNTATPATATTAAATTAAAASATTAAAPGAATTAPAAPAANLTGTVRILIHQNKPLVDFMNKQNEKFKQKYPNVTVDLSVVTPDVLDQSIQTRLTAGDLDLFENTQAFTNAPQEFMKGVDDPTWVQWIKGGLLEDLTTQPFIKNYDANALKDASSYQGKIYAVSTGRYAYSGVFYNKDIFSQNNLKVPTTYAEFIALADALKAKNIAPMTAGGKDGWPVGVVGLPAGLLLGSYPDQQALVKNIWTGQTKFNDARSQTYFDRGKQLLGYYETGVASIDYQTAPGRFASGKAAMYPGGTWDAPTILTANPKMNLGYFPLPASDNAADNKIISGKYDVQWYVPAKSPNKAAALAWLEFFSQQDNYADYVNTVGILSNQPSVNLQADYAKEITPYLPTFKVAFSEMMLAPKNVGKYAGFALNNYTPFGDVNDSKDLAAKSEADWESALKK